MCNPKPETRIPDSGSWSGHGRWRVRARTCHMYLPHPRSRIPDPETRIPKPGSRNPDPEIRIPDPASRIPEIRGQLLVEPESRIPSPGFWIVKWARAVARPSNDQPHVGPETRIPSPETRNLKPETWQHETRFFYPRDPNPDAGRLYSECGDSRPVLSLFTEYAR